MKRLVFFLLIALACSLSFLAGRQTNGERRWADSASHHTNELDNLSRNPAAQK